MASSLGQARFSSRLIGYQSGGKSPLRQRSGNPPPKKTRATKATPTRSWKRPSKVRNFLFPPPPPPSQQLNSQIADLAARIVIAGQATLSQGLGPSSDAFVWPRRDAQKSDEDVDENEVESFNNRRLMRLGAFRSRVANAYGFYPSAVAFFFFFCIFQVTTLTTLSHPIAVPSLRRTKDRTKRTTKTTTLSRRTPRCPPPFLPLPRLARKSSRPRSACRSIGPFRRVIRSRTLASSSRPSVWPATYPCVACVRPSSPALWKEFRLSKVPCRNAQRSRNGWIDGVT